MSPVSDRPTRRRTRVAEGIYKDRWGLAATVKVHGVQREIRFPPSTPLKTIRARRDQLRASLRTLPHGKRHTLAHDAGRYLKQISGELVSIADAGTTLASGPHASATSAPWRCRSIRLRSTINCVNGARRCPSPRATIAGMR